MFPAFSRSCWAEIGRHIFSLTGFQFGTALNALSEFGQAERRGTARGHF